VISAAQIPGIDFFAVLTGLDGRLRASHLLHIHCSFNCIIMSFKAKDLHYGMCKSQGKRAELMECR
jgi:hypothetical protein